MQAPPRPAGHLPSPRHAVMQDQLGKTGRQPRRQAHHRSLIEVQFPYQELATPRAGEPFGQPLEVRPPELCARRDGEQALHACRVAPQTRPTSPVIGLEADA